MFITLRENALEFFQYLQYRVFRSTYTFPIPHTINFDTEIDEKNKTLFISSPEYPGLYTITPIDDEQKIFDLVNDAIFTYFDVPRYIARRTKNHFFPNGFEPGKRAKFVYPKGLAFA